MVGDEETDMLRRVAGGVHYVDNHIAERQAVAFRDRMRRKADFGTGIQHIFGAGLAGESAPGGTMIGVDVGIDDEADSHAGLVGHAQIGSDVADRIDDGAGGVPAAAAGS